MLLLCCAALFRRAGNLQLCRNGTAHGGIATWNNSGVGKGLVAGGFVLAEILGRIFLQSGQGKAWVVFAVISRCASTSVLGALGASRDTKYPWIAGTGDGHGLCFSGGTCGIQSAARLQGCNKDSNKKMLVGGKFLLQWVWRCCWGSWKSH